MKKRRATARDRDIVDWLNGMKPGKWTIEVEEDPPRHAIAVGGFGLAEIKREGSIRIEFPQTIVRIWPN